jgi:hypothetical protein
MAVLGTLGIIAALGVLALMALAPALITLNDRYPVHTPEDPDPADDRRSVELRRPSLLERRTPAHSS